MREILFRAKSNYGNVGEWEYGLIAQPHVTENGIVTSYYFTKICENGWTSQRTVSANTIGQYTGLTDRNGNKIFEGDIVESRASEVKEDWKIWQVGFEDGCFVFDSVRKSIKSRRKFKHEQNILCVDEIKFYGLEVIGNIHDNPELLKEGAE